MNKFTAMEALTERRISTFDFTNSGDPNVADRARKEVEIIDVLLALIDGTLAAVGPKGDKGDPGDPGQQGPKGDKGDPGAAGSVIA